MRTTRSEGERKVKRGGRSIGFVMLSRKGRKWNRVVYSSFVREDGRRWKKFSDLRCAYQGRARSNGKGDHTGRYPL